MLRQTGKEEKRVKKYSKAKQYDKEVLDKLHAVQVEMLKDFAQVCEKHGLSYFAVYGTAIGAVRHAGFIPWDDDIDVGMLRSDYDKFMKIFPKEMKEKYNLLTPQIDGRYSCTVTHIQRKGTKFVSEVTKDLKCEQCIFMDIFPFDYVPQDRKKQISQSRKANILGKLLFLSGNPNPVIEYDGIKGETMALACRLIHIILKLFRVKPECLYKKYIKNATKYNMSSERGRYVTSFEYVGGLKDKIVAKDIFPLKKVPFEDIEINLPNNNDKFLKKVYGDYMKLPPEDQRVNHMPLIIQFEGEEPIYAER